MYLDCGAREWNGNGTVCGKGEREGALVQEGRGGEGRGGERVCTTLPTCHCQ